MRSLIVNADDFGLSSAVNRGILHAFRQGILTLTTLLVNLPHFDDAVALARSHPELPVGIHLSLLWGPPVAPPAQIPSLLERDGRFPRSLSVLARRYFLGALSAEQVRIELGHQVRRVLDAGLSPTHLDTHKHVHCLPGILEVVISVAREYGLEKIRLPCEQEGRFPAPWPGRAKRSLIRLLCRRARERCFRAGIRTTDHFVGIGQMAHLDANVLSGILDRLDRGVTELMCHPGHVDDDAREYSRTPPHREAELDALCDPKLEEAVARNGIRLINYRDL